MSNPARRPCRSWQRLAAGLLEPPELARDTDRGELGLKRRDAQGRIREGEHTQSSWHAVGRINDKGASRQGRFHEARNGPLA
jgi:hypothetical protein